MMTKAQLRAELFRVKNAMRDALLEEIYRGGDTQAPLYGDMRKLWGEMNQKNYN